MITVDDTANRDANRNILMKHIQVRNRAYDLYAARKAQFFQDPAADSKLFDLDTEICFMAAHANGKQAAEWLDLLGGLASTW